MPVSGRAVSEFGWQLRVLDLRKSLVVCRFEICVVPFGYSLVMAELAFSPTNFRSLENSFVKVFVGAFARAPHHKEREARLCFIF